AAQSFSDPTTVAAAGSAAYRVLSVDAEGNVSGWNTGNTVYAKPRAITDLNAATSPTASANEVTYGASASLAGISRYRIYAKQQADPLTGGDILPANNIGETATAVKFVHDMYNPVMPAQAGKPYAYAVIVEDINGLSSDMSWGATTVSTVPDRSAPDKVTDLAVSTVPDTVQVTLAWTTPLDNMGLNTPAYTGASQYEIYRLPTSLVNPAAPVTDANFQTATKIYTGTYASKTAGTANTYNDTGWYDHEDAYYAVRSRDAAGNWSQISNSPFIIVGKDVQAPVPPVITDCVPGPSPEVDVYWEPATDNVEVNGYRMFRADQDAEPFHTDGCITVNNVQYAETAISLIDYSATAATDSGGTPGKTYFYALRAWDFDNNWSNISNCGIATVRRPDSDGRAPTWGGASPLAVVANGYPDIVLIWTAATDKDDADNDGVIDHYDVYRSPGSFTSTSQAEKIDTVAGIGTYYVDSSGDHDTTYYYGIVAVDASAAHNQSALSNVAYATVAPAPSPDNTVPATPGGLAAATGSYPFINLSWTASTDVDDADNSRPLLCYKLYRAAYPFEITDGTKGLPNVDVVVVANDATSYQSRGTGSTKYNYRIEAVDMAGNVSALSSVATATVAAAPCTDTTPPSVPGSFSAVIGPSPDIILSWTASVDSGCGVIDHYNMYRAAYDITDENIGSITPVRIAGNSTSYTDSSGQPNTAYRYVIKAADSFGNLSGKSTMLTVTTAADTMAPAAITDLSAADLGGGTVELTWCRPSDNVGIHHYEIYRKQQATILTDADLISLTPDIMTNAGTCLSHRYTGLGAGNHAFAVIAVDGSSNRSTISRGPITVLSVP
ncbi:MAG TPA: hypothetical protein VJM83_01700, partial [Nitrospirota bacterium]|nr:hypothetical protein [Nitrospirota bacterium]